MVSETAEKQSNERSVLDASLFQNDRYMVALQQACERHGRLWTSLVRCERCQNVQVCSVPAVWGFAKAKCFACGTLGVSEIPSQEFHSQAVLGC